MAPLQAECDSPCMSFFFDVLFYCFAMLVVTTSTNVIAMVLMEMRCSLSYSLIILLHLAHVSPPIILWVQLPQCLSSRSGIWFSFSVPWMVHFFQNNLKCHSFFLSFWDAKLWAYFFGLGGSFPIVNCQVPFPSTFNFSYCRT